MAIVYKAGDNVASSEAIMLAEFCNEAESQVCAITRKDWITDYASVKANFKPILADATSDLAAMKLISRDMSGYTSRAEAQTMLDVMRDNFVRCIENLKEEAIKEKM
jgi:hypothetical protein